MAYLLYITRKGKLHEKNIRPCFVLYGNCQKDVKWAQAAEEADEREWVSLPHPSSSPSPGIN